MYKERGMFVDQSSGRQSSFSAAVVKGVWFATAVSLSLAVAIPLTAADPKTPSESERLVAAAVQAASGALVVPV